MEIVWKGMLPKGKMMEEFMQQQNYEIESTTVMNHQFGWKLKIVEKNTKQQKLK